MNIDIDNIVDYKLAYAGIEKAKISGDGLIGLCPFHHDTNASFSVNLNNGMYKCFSCGAEGNYVKFVAEQKGMSTKDAYLSILQAHGITEDGVKVAGKSRSVCTDSYTIEDYAREKQLPAAWLKESWGFREGTDKKVGSYISMPYFNENQEQACFRKRYPKGASQRFAWSNGAKGNLVLYGIWLMEKIREEGYVILCEGESDTQTLWHLGFPALGVPGATTFKPEWAADLAGLKLFLHIEPDQGGQTFRAAMLKKLGAGEFLGEVATFSCGPTGSKDPSDLYIKEGAAAKDKLKELLEKAKPVDLAEENMAEAIPGAPKNLRQPEGWIYSEKGISIIEERTQQPRCICRTPIILTKRMRNEVGEEKIEVAWRRDGMWRTAIFPRTVIFQSKSITCLTDMGCTITSENAKSVVAFLQALEAENMDALEVVDSTSHCGWQSKERFVPGAGGDLVLDVSPQMQSVAAGYCKNGTFAAWAEGMRGHRERPIFRAFIAASFAAPLLKPLKVRNFILYNWQESSSGKTAALKAALSVWGDPNRLMISCDSTKVALERRASFFCDLPFGIDERQSAGGRQEFLENLAYMLANGVGRSRASKEEGGLQSVLSWRTIAIMTGEEPLMQNATKGGVSNRTLEIYGAPFKNLEKEAVEIHQTCDDNCGWAGPMFVERLIQENIDSLKDRYHWWMQRISSMVSIRRQAHVASIALLATADELAEEWIFGNTADKARRGADLMARTIADAASESDPDDVNDRALQFVQNWVLTNWKNFQGAENAPIYGWIEDDCVCIVPAVLRTALEEARFSSRKSFKAFTEQGVLRKGADGKNVIPKRNKKAGMLLRVLCFNKEALIGEDAQVAFAVVAADEPLPF